MSSNLEQIKIAHLIMEDNRFIYHAAVFIQCVVYCMKKYIAAQQCSVSITARFIALFHTLYIPTIINREKTSKS